MKKLLLILFATLLTNSFSQTNVSQQLSEIKESNDQIIKSRILSSSVTSFIEDRNNWLNINDVKIRSGTEEQDEIPNFYPLAIGNKWIYDGYYITNGNSYQRLYITEVNGIYLKPNGKLYYILKAYSVGQPGEGISYERIDSSSAKIYRYDENLGLPDDEYLIDDLLAESGDTVHSYRFYPPGSSFTLFAEETQFEKWGLTKTKRVFQQIVPGIPKPTYSLTLDIGMDSMFFDWDNNTTHTYVLKGCVLNRIVYGDTITVSVDDEEKPIATEFRLAQNYPNPFNPSTVIGYQLPVSGNVTLKVYDVLGNEVATLVDEYKPAGEYEVTFDVGTSRDLSLSSGIYFYQLLVPALQSKDGKAGSFVETKKMILLK